MEKLPSPDAKPDIQLGSGIFSIFIIGLSTGVKNLNSDLNWSKRPKLIDAFKLTTWCKPSIFKWVLLFIISTTCLNNKKSAAFWVNKEYFFKWLTNINNSLLELII